jgi:predicted ATPase
MYSLRVKIPQSLEVEVTILSDGTLKVMAWIQILSIGG